MASIETTKILIFDPVELANTIEMIARPYLRLENKKVNKEPEYVFDRRGRPIGLMEEYIKLMAPLNGKQCGKQLTLPVIGIGMIKDYVDRLILKYSAWSKQGTPTLQSIWSKYLLLEYEYTDDVYGLIENILGELHSDIVNFIAGETWMMHFLKVRNRDIIIEKTCDFRVHYYMQHIHGS